MVKSGEKFRRGLIVSDGVVTAGTDRLQDAVAALNTLGVERIDAVAVGGIRDQEALQRLVRGVLPNEGLVIDGGLPLALIAKKLNHKARSGIKVSVPGADWVWPETLDGVQPGEQALVYADLAADKPFSITLDGKAVPAGTMKSAARPLLERAWVAARMKKLLDKRGQTKDPDMSAAISKQVVEMSVQYRVLCPLTALLVLETENDYARFGINRKALADILIVDGATVNVMSRKTPQYIAAMKTPPPPPPPRRLEEKKLAPMTGGAPPTDGLALGRAAPGGSPAATAAAPKEMAADKAEASPRKGKASADMDDLMDAKAEAKRDEAPPPPAMEPRAQEGEAEERPRSIPQVAQQAIEPEQPQAEINPYTGPFLEIMTAVRKKDTKLALGKADAWWRRSPGDVMALVALGEACEASGNLSEAARAYGSLIDLFPARADMRRFAGLRLERLQSEAALALAVDTYGKALIERPDHPQSHRLLAYVLLKTGQPEKAFDVLEKGHRVRYPDDRFRGVEQIMSEDLGLAAQAWIKAQPERRDEIYKRLQAAGGQRENAPSLRFVLSWETDANDVDFHIYDGKGGHAYYASQELPSGGQLYADVTTGYGPECFTIRGKQRAYPYKLQAHYYSRGPMGYGMGKLQIVQHDGAGTLTFEERPFIVMQDQAFLDLGKVTRAL